MVTPLSIEIPSRRRGRSPIQLRSARRDESAALAELFAQVRMDADLSLSVERDPDFFALYDLDTPADDQAVFGCELDGRVECVGAYLGREAYVGGRRTRVAYMSDLRATPRFSANLAFGDVLTQSYAAARRALGTELMVTVVFDSNRLAQRALVERSPRFPDKPRYWPVQRFTIQSVLLLQPFAPRLPRYRVRRARREDLDVVVSLLARDHAQRPFGYAFDGALLERRLRSWPRLNVESFQLALDRRDNIVGLAAAWDPFDVKRYRVHDYRGAMPALRRRHDFVARLLGTEPLPAPGSLLRYLYLTHVCVPSEDPGIMAALLDAIYRDSRGRGYCFLSAYVAEGDPLAPAYRGYLTTGMAATLYAVTPSDEPLDPAALGRGRAGFEMALA